MEEIKVFRALPVTDAYGDPQYPIDTAEWPLWNTFSGLFAPSNPSEALPVASNKVIRGGEIYIRGTAPTGIRATDQVEARGHRFNVDGDVGEWAGREGYKGDQFAVKAVS